MRLLCFVCVAALAATLFSVPAHARVSPPSLAAALAAESFGKITR